LSIETGRLPVNPHPGRKPVVDSVYVTRTLQLDTRSQISKLLEDISTRSAIEFDSGLRKLQATIRGERDFDIKVSVKQTSTATGDETTDGPGCTDRIRLRIETSQVSYKSVESALQSVLKVCNQLQDRINPVWDRTGTYSLTVVLQDQIVEGREVSRTRGGLIMEVFGPNVRVRGAEEDDLNAAIRILKEL
jgi:hypothetical protein